MGARMQGADVRLRFSCRWALQRQGLDDGPLPHDDELSGLKPPPRQTVCRARAPERRRRHDDSLALALTAARQVDLHVVIADHQLRVGREQLAEMKRFRAKSISIRKEIATVAEHQIERSARI